MTFIIKFKRHKDLSDRSQKDLFDSPEITAMGDIKYFSSVTKLYGNRHERHVGQYQLFISSVNFGG